MANERRIRLIQVAKEFNVGINTITDFLQKKGVKSDGSPNALVDAETYALLEKEFGAGRAVNSERVNIRERIAQKRRPSPSTTTRRGKGGKNDEELLVKSNVISVKDEVASMGPKILGKIDLSGKGPKAAPAATPAPAPRPAAKPAPTPAPAPAAVPGSGRTGRADARRGSRAAAGSAGRDASGGREARPCGACGDADARTGTAHGFGRGAAEDLRRAAGREERRYFPSGDRDADGPSGARQDRRFGHGAGRQA